MRVLALAGLLAIAGCGGGDDDAGVVVGAASSLTAALTSCLPDVGAQGEYGGSDDIAAQIRQGVGIDVFAAANMRLPESLAAEGEAQDPVPFATNELVLAVPAGSTLRGLGDLPGTTVVVGAGSVPVGAYTREVLSRLPAKRRAAIEDAVRSEEPDVKGIVGKLVTGAADAGFVYRTDVTGVGDALVAIALPTRLQPTVVYGISIVSPGERAEKVVEDILGGGCADALRKAGFGPAPG